MNKSTLLAGTALVSMALIMGATSASAMKLKLSGYYTAEVGFGDNDNTGTDVVNNFDVKSDSEIHFKASEKLSNGWTVGATLEMEAGTGRDSAGGAFFDESSLFVKFNGHQIIVGNNDLATAYIGSVSTVGPVGVYLSDAGDWIPGSYPLSNTSVDLGLGDAGLIVYITPRVGGLQLIVSYTPDASDGASSAYDNQETSGKHHGISAALKYKRKIGGGSVALSGGATTLENTDAAATDDTSSGYALRAEIKNGPVKVTAAYAYENLSSIDTYFGVGVIYTTSKTDKVSVGWSRSLKKRITGGADSLSSDVLAFGYQKNLGKGASIGASVFKAANNGDATDFDNWGGVAGIKITF